jgi:SsrA-binding protein
MKIIASNKRASFDYHLTEKFEAGIVLKGSEVKSIRTNGMSINQSFVHAEDGQLFLKNAYIKPYETSSVFAQPERRNRKLLLHKKQILRLQKSVQADSLSIVPTKVYFLNGLVKVEIALAKGKKNYDKRQSLADKSAKREVERAVKKAFSN